MNDYLLFIDTETSGIPSKWNVSYADVHNWPSVIQLAWIICDTEGREIKRVCKYIYEDDISITKKSFEIHGISMDFLKKNGAKRKEILRKLSHDIKKYKPMIIGHFIELDVHVLNADYYRAKLKSPFMTTTDYFCTMLHSRKFAHHIQQDTLRLPQLFQHLFDETPSHLHEAENDAELTAKCFLELQKRKNITTKEYDTQQKYIFKKFNFSI